MCRRPIFRSSFLFVVLMLTTALQARPWGGRWIGANVDMYALGTVPVSESGFAGVEWFRVR